jgi:hypothetical protein
VLRVDPDELDAWRFERSVQEGRALVDTDPAAASIVLGEGLALCRGRPYEDVAYEPFAQPEFGRLEELRLEAVGLSIDADLRRCLSSELVGELESLVRQNPVREGFTANLWSLSTAAAGGPRRSVRSPGCGRVSARSSASNRPSSPRPSTPSACDPAGRHGMPSRPACGGSTPPT